MKEFFTKRRILIIVVIVLVLAILALLFLPGSGRKAQSFQGGEETLYPYEWTEKEDGSIRLSLCRQVPEGCVWRCAQEASESVLVKQDEKEAGTFHLQPLQAGDVLLRFILADEVFPEDRCCELLLTVETLGEEKDLRASVSGNRLAMFDKTLGGGESFGCPYRIWTDDEDRLVIGLADDSPEPDWQLFQQNSGDVVRLVGRSSENGILALRFRGSEAGSSRLRLYSAARRLTLELTLALDGEGALTVQSHEMAAHPEWEGMETGALDAFVVAGDISTPEGAEELRYGRRSIGQQKEAAALSFRYLDADWTVYVTVGSELEELIAREFEKEKILTLVVNGRVMRACFREEEGSVTAWCAVGERWYLIEGKGDVDMARLLETANGIITETDG